MHFKPQESKTDELILRKIMGALEVKEDEFDENPVMIEDWLRKSVTNENKMTEDYPSLKAKLINDSNNLS